MWDTIPLFQVLFSNVLSPTAELTWYSPSATYQCCHYGLEHCLGIHGFMPTCLYQIIKVLAFREKILPRSGKCNLIKWLFTFCTTDVLGPLSSNQTQLHVHLSGWQIPLGIKQFTTCQHTNCYIVIYIIIHHNDTISNKDRRTQKDAWRKMQEQRTHEDFFRKIFTSHFIARVRKGCWRFACERVLETEHKLHIMTVTLCLSCSLRCSTRGLGVHSIGAFPRAPSVGWGLPYHIWSLLSGILLATALGLKLNWVKK